MSDTTNPLATAESLLAYIKDYYGNDPEDMEIYITYLILGKKPFDLVVYDEKSDMNKHCVWAVMEAVYQDYRNDPKGRIDRTLKTALTEGLQYTTNSRPSGLRNAIECLAYQVEHQDNKTAPFKLNCRALVKILRKSVKDLVKDNFIDIYEEYIDFMYYDNYFRSNVGRGIV